MKHILQTSIFCPQNTSATVSFSTAGTGILSVWTVGGDLALRTIDHVYAGLFEEEVVANVTLSAGWNDLQVKSLSHYSTVAGWQVQANVATNASSGCVIDACGQNILAAMCADVP